MVNGTAQLKLTHIVQFLVCAYPIEIERRRQLHGNYGYSLGPDSQLDPGEEILLTAHSCCRLLFWPMKRGSHNAIWSQKVVL